MLENLILGMQAVSHVDAIVAILFGVVWGVFGGMIPGINATIAMALLLPFTFGMQSHVAVMMLAGVYCGGEYGGSIPAILIGTPGTTPAACTVIDGYPMHQQGRTGEALGISLFASVIGGLFGATALVIVAIPLAQVAISFGPSEYFALAILGLTLICSLGGKNVFKGILAGIFGVFLATVGFDPIVGAPRFTFGIPSLLDGFKMISLMMGLFAVSELFLQAEKVREGASFILKSKADTSFPKFKVIKKILPTTFFSSTLGVIIGALPGAGATVAAFIAYSETKRWSKDKDSFGKGNIKGVAAPESANNAVTGGALVPLLALGIPGSNSTAIMLGALVIHNINPGPLLFSQTPEIPYGIFCSLFVANIFMLLVGFLAIKVAIKVTNISQPVLIACIMALVFTGAYAYSGEVFDIFVTLIFGILGYVMKKYEVPHTSTVLGFVLGFIMETNIRRAIIISQGNVFDAFFNSTLSTTMLVIAFISVVYTLVQNIRRSRLA